MAETGAKQTAAGPISCLHLSTGLSPPTRHWWCCARQTGLVVVAVTIPAPRPENHDVQ